MALILIFLSANLLANTLVNWCTAAFEAGYEYVSARGIPIPSIEPTLITLEGSELVPLFSSNLTNFWVKKNIDLKDNQGKFNCGKPTGYIKDFKALPVDTQDVIRQIKRVRVIFGTVNLTGSVDDSGNKVDKGTIPFIWEIDNRDAFKTMGEPFKK